MPRRVSPSSTTPADPLVTAMRLFDQGRLAESAPWFQQVLRVDRHHPTAMAKLGAIARHMGMPDRAIRLLRQALRDGGQSAELLNELGSAFVESGDIENARRCFQRCIDHFPASSLGYVSLAYLANLGGDFERAEALYLAAVAGADESLEAAFNLATLYREWGHLQQAIDHYDALIARHGDVPLFADGRALRPAANATLA